MIFAKLRERLRRIEESAPSRRLRRAVELLPEEAFQLEGMDYSRSEVRKWLDANEYEVLIGVLAGIGDEYEEQHEALSEHFWSDLEAAAERLGLSEVLAPFVERGDRRREWNGAPAAQATFLERERAGHFLKMRDGGSSPGEIAMAAIQAGGSDIDVARLLRELFLLQHGEAVVALREAKMRSGVGP